MNDIDFHTAYYWDTRAALVSLKARESDLSAEEYKQELDYLMDELSRLVISATCQNLKDRCLAALWEFGKGAAASPLEMTAGA